MDNNNLLKIAVMAFIESMRGSLSQDFVDNFWKEHNIHPDLSPEPHISQPRFQMILSLANQMSKGLEISWEKSEQEPGTPWDEHKKKRLLPVFELLNPESYKTDSHKTDSQQTFSYYYPLKKISPENIFPINHNSPEHDKESGDPYKKLFEDIEKKLGQVRHRKNDPARWFENFESLMMLYISHVPLTGPDNAHSDISLYDHCRISAAIAVAMWAYHSHKDREESFSEQALEYASEYASEQASEQDIEDNKARLPKFWKLRKSEYYDKKFMIVSGGISGIQNYIFQGYGESRRYRSKLLRGRSFAVSLLTELAVDMLCRKAELPHTSVILNAAGRFSLLAPNIPKTKKAMNDAEAEINKWLISLTYGETVITLSSQEAACSDFVQGGFLKLWEKIELEKEEKKFKRIDLDNYGGEIGWYLDSFDNTLEHPLCPICGKRPSCRRPEWSREYMKQDQDSCYLCRDHIFLGTNLVKKNKIAVIREETATRDSLLEPIFGKYQVVFSEKENSENFEKDALLRYWDLGREPKGHVAVKFINGYVPVCDEKDEMHIREFFDTPEKKEEYPEKGDPKTLNLIAAKAKKHISDSTFQGISALGVLKADVDDLGLLIACGLPQDKFSLVRLSTMSRQLNSYFAVYLPRLLEEDPGFNDTYTVFAGGDDLFLIGPWNRIIELAVKLRNHFEKYVCGNKNVHFSAGISLHKPHTPVDVMAESAEHELEKSKNKGKNRITLFSETVPWNWLEHTDKSPDPIPETLNNVREILLDWLDKEKINKAMLFRLNELMQMAEKEKHLIALPDRKFQDMSCAKWRSMLAYTVARNAAKNADPGERPEIVTQVAASLGKWLNNYAGALKIPVWNILYNRR